MKTAKKPAQTHWYCAGYDGAEGRQAVLELCHGERSLRVHVGETSEGPACDWWVDGAPVAFGTPAEPEAIAARAAEHGWPNPRWTAAALLKAFGQPDLVATARLGPGRIRYEVEVPEEANAPFLGVAFWEDGSLRFLAELPLDSVRPGPGQWRVVAEIGKGCVPDWVFVETRPGENGRIVHAKVPFGMDESVLHGVLLALVRLYGSEPWCAGVTSERVSVFEILRFDDAPLVMVPVTA